MSLQKKCLTASAIAHGLLVLLVVVGSAFIPQQPKIEGVEFEIIDIPLDALVEEPNVISGRPEAGRPPDVAPVQAVQPIRIPQPQPQPPEPVRQPEPERTVKPPDNPEPNPFDLSKAKTIKTTPKPPDNPQQNFDLSKAKRQVIKPPQDNPDNSRAATERANRAAELAKELEGARQALQRTGSRVGISHSDIIGPGGRVAMSYDIAVAKIYENEFQRHPVAAAANDRAVTVEVTVRRDGTVTSERILQSSGRAQVNRAVRQTLNNVNKVVPFPSDFSSDSRTITIHFNPADF